MITAARIVSQEQEHFGDVLTDLIVVDSWVLTFDNGMQVFAVQNKRIRRPGDLGKAVLGDFGFVI